MANTYNDESGKIKNQYASATHEELWDWWRLKGDEAAATMLFAHFYGKMIIYFKKRCGSFAEAEELAQQLMIHVLVNCIRHAVTKFKPWIYSVAYHFFIKNYLKRHKNDTLEDNPGHPQLKVSQTHSLEFEELLLFLQSNLSENQYKCLYLGCWIGLSYDEIAAELGISANAVRTCLYTGRKHLSSLLNRPPGGNSP